MNDDPRPHSADERAEDHSEVVLTTLSGEGAAEHAERNETPTEQVARLQQTQQLFGFTEPDDEDG